MDELLATETLKLLNGCSKMHMLGLCTCAMKKMLYLMPVIEAKLALIPVRYHIFPKFSSKTIDYKLTYDQ